MTDQLEDLSFSSADDFTGDIIGSQNYEFPSIKKKVFLPWHKPRKQFVRTRQWEALIRDLVSTERPESGVIKYLGLPGDDFLDLRHFHEKICEPNELKLRFLGFNDGIKSGSEESAQIEISLDEVNRLPFIDKSSKLIPDDFTTISASNSIAWQHSVSMGPFDVINIDLCDGFANHSPDNFIENHYETLNRLMALQARRSTGWVLLLTTRTDSERVDEGVFRRLKSGYLQSLAECDDFLQASTELFTVSNESELDACCQDSAGFSNIFLTALCKWILRIGSKQQRPPSKVEVKSIFGYKVVNEATSPDLMSIGIKVTPTFETDSDSIGLLRQTREPLNECDLACRMITKVSNRKNVDELLYQQADLMNSMIKESSDLLEQARYDVTGFEAWARSNVG